MCRKGKVITSEPLGKDRKKFSIQKYLVRLYLLIIRCDTTKYACSTWRMRGDVVCSNSLKVSRKLVESVLLESIQKDLFTEEGLEVFKEEVARLLAEHRLTRQPD